MSSVANSLLMCVCAGTMGAISVPVTKKIVRPRPAVQRTVQQAAPAVPLSLENLRGCDDSSAAALIAASDAMPDLTGFAEGASFQAPATQVFSGPTARGLESGFMPPIAPLSQQLPGGLPGGVQLVSPGIPEIAASAVPEPGAWILMISGFGAAGAAMRVRRGRPAGALS